MAQQIGQDVFGYNTTQSAINSYLQLRVTLYGFIPIAMPSRIIQTIGNSIIKTKQDDTTTFYSHSVRNNYTIQVFGYLVGNSRFVWKRILETIADLQSTKRTKRGAKAKGRLTIILSSLLAALGGGSLFLPPTTKTYALPFITEMGYIPSCVIQSISFFHKSEQKDAISFIMTLESIKDKLTYRTAALQSAFAGARTLQSVIAPRFKNLDNPDEDVEFGWGLSENPKVTLVRYHISSDQTKDGVPIKEYDPTTEKMVENTDVNWLEFRALDPSKGFPQSVLVRVFNNDSKEPQDYAFQFRFINSKGGNFLQFIIRKDNLEGDVLINTRASIDKVYRLDKYKYKETLTRTVAGVEESYDTYKVGRRLFFGFSKIDIIRSLNNPSGETSTIVASIANNSITTT